MSPLSFQHAQTLQDLQGILDLQLKNHLHQIQSLDQGFLFVRHDLETLQKMKAYAPQIICKDGKEVVAFVLAMAPECKSDVPALVPMFEIFEKIDYKGRRISDYRYIVVGQVCVGENYRGKGLFEENYRFYRNTFEKECDFAITEISLRNQRSIRAHAKLGFEEIHQYTDPTGEEWSIVVWDWRQ